ncbi:hypothetical protein OUZ56_004604 [Daphnia magna]|uniref:Uncharacterized protein n=1 Tax=Daphnia magna TaxID=35525 RepID=A0ABQ9YQC9_9CRUS|nr:hypothetical protein OUZ56_004604 [Daphnia magna]
MPFGIESTYLQRVNDRKFLSLADYSRVVCTKKRFFCRDNSDDCDDRLSAGLIIVTCDSRTYETDETERLLDKGPNISG